MAPTPQIRLTQGQIIALTEGGGQVRLTQAATLAAYNFPTPQIRVTQAEIKYAVTAGLDIRLTQAQMLVAAKGRLENRRLRAWGFTLDGHEFYVLRLGETETLVCDLTTGQWAQWNDGEKDFWRAHVGATWVGMDKTTYDRGFETNIIGGDDTFGVLWILAPDQGYDEHPSTSEKLSFDRVATGALPARLRDTISCNAVYATIDLGDPALAGTTATLRTSDDRGQTWFDHGSLTVASGDYDQEFSWRSLGNIKAPGRIFELQDDGVRRIDTLDME